MKARMLTLSFSLLLQHIGSIWNDTCKAPCVLNNLVSYLLHVIIVIVSVYLIQYEFLGYLKKFEENCPN